MGVNDKKELRKSTVLDKVLPLVKKYGIFVIIILLLIKLNKPLFFIVLFTLLTFAGKQVRGQFGLKMVVLDPFMLSAVLLAKYIGLKEAIIFIAINTLIIDFITNIASIGTFLNFTLYSASVTIAIFIFGGLELMYYGNIASLMYSISYYFFRMYVLPDDPVAVTSKSITSFLFTFLYISFFGPIFGLIMG